MNGWWSAPEDGEGGLEWLLSICRHWPHAGISLNTWIFFYHVVLVSRGLQGLFFLFLTCLRIITLELDEKDDAFLGKWGSGLFCSDLLALFCDINWVQRGIRQGHVKPNYSATWECHYFPLKPIWWPLGTLRRIFLLSGRKIAKLKGEYLRADRKSHTIIVIWEINLPLSISIT